MLVAMRARARARRRRASDGTRSNARAVSTLVTGAVVTALAVACARGTTASAGTVTAVRAMTTIDGATVGSGDDVVVRATVETSGWSRRAPTATLTCRAGRNAESGERMRDDGAWPDEKANDGVYAGRCRTGGCRRVSACGGG